MYMFFTLPESWLSLAWSVPALLPTTAPTCQEDCTTAKQEGGATQGHGGPPHGDRGSTPLRRLLSAAGRVVPTFGPLGLVR